MIWFKRSDWNSLGSAPLQYCFSHLSFLFLDLFQMILWDVLCSISILSLLLVVMVHMNQCNSI